MVDVSFYLLEEFFSHLQSLKIGPSQKAKETGLLQICYKRTTPWKIMLRKLANQKRRKTTTHRTEALATRKTTDKRPNNQRLQSNLKPTRGNTPHFTRIRCNWCYASPPPGQRARGREHAFSVLQRSGRCPVITISGVISAG